MRWGSFGTQSVIATIKKVGMGELPWLDKLQIVAQSVRDTSA